MASPRYVDSGKVYLARGDAPHALVQFRRALLANPRDPESHYEAGLAYLAMHDAAAAFTQLSAAVQLRPDFRDAREKLAELYASTHHQEFVGEANRIASSLLATDARDPALLNLVAITELELGERDKALMHLKTAVDDAPAYLRSYLNLAAVQASEGRFSTGIGTLEIACREAPDSALVAIAMARTYGLMHDLDSSEREFRRAEALDSGKSSRIRADALEGLASILVARGNKAEAAATYRKLAGMPDGSRRFAFGQYLLDAGQYDEAAAEFRRLFEQNPSNRDARTRLIGALRASGRTRQIQSLVSEALTRNPKDIEALLERGRLELEEGQTARAMEDVRLVIASGSNLVAAHLLLARIYSLRQSEKMVREELDAALRLNPSLLGARLELAQSYLHANNADAALETLRMAPQSQRESLPVVLCRNAAFLAQGNDDIVASLLPGQIARFHHPDLLLQNVSLLRKTGWLEQSRRAIAEALSAGANLTRAYELLAGTYEDEHRPEKALDALRTAAVKYPAEAGLQLALARRLADARMLPEARQAYTAAASSSEYFESATVGLAELEIADRHPAIALALAQSILRRASRSVAGLLAAAVANVASGDERGAISFYQRVLEADPDNVRALNDLAWLLGNDASRLDEALGYARRAAQVQPGNSTVNDTLGWLLYRRGFHNSAIRHLETAVGSAGGSSAMHRYHLAIAYASAGDRIRAAAEYRKAWTLDRNMAEASHARSIVFGDPHR